MREKPTLSDYPDAISWYVDYLGWQLDWEMEWVRAGCPLKGRD